MNQQNLFKEIEQLDKELFGILCEMFALQEKCTVAWRKIHELKSKMEE